MELQRTSTLCIGIKTGGPSVPFLFIPSMEGISLMLHRAMTLNGIKGFNTGETRLDRVMLSYVLYADDILILCGTEEKLRYLRAILLLVEAVSV